MLDEGANCGKGGTTMAAVHGPGDHWWRRVWSGRTNCGLDNLRRDRYHIILHGQTAFSVIICGGKKTEKHGMDM